MLYSLTTIIPHTLPARNKPVTSHGMLNADEATSVIEPVSNVVLKPSSSDLGSDPIITANPRPTVKLTKTASSKLTTARIKLQS